MEKLSVLLIEDNLAIAMQLAEFMAGLGWDIDHALCGAQGIQLALDNPYDVVLLDINLPDTDGFTVCRTIKEQSLVNLPILMLTARDAFEDKAEGFGRGADDYVTKPFEFRELALRCQALARRRNLYQNKTLRVGGLVLDRAQRTASREGRPLRLTKTAFDILTELAEAYPQAVTRTHLTHKLWAHEPPDSDTLRSHIYSLRTALDKPFLAPMLKTIINVGYKLELPEDV